RSADRRAKAAADTAIEQAAELDVDQMVEWHKSSWREARAALDLAKGRLGDRGSTELRRRIEQGERDLGLALRLEAMSASVGGNLDNPSAAEGESLFRNAGIGETTESAEVVAARVSASDIRDALVRALDEWAFYSSDRNAAEHNRRMWTAEVARLADPDP